MTKTEHRLITNIIFLRKKNGITQDIVAKRTGTKRVNVCAWELRTCIPQLPQLLLLSHLYNCSIDDLCRKDFTKTQEL